MNIVKLVRTYFLEFGRNLIELGSDNLYLHHARIKAAICALAALCDSRRFILRDSLNSR